MRVAITEEEMTVADAPIGLLLIESTNTIIMKTEYHRDNRCECYIVSSGERFCGKGDAEIVKAMVLI